MANALRLETYIKDAERFLKHRMWESDPPSGFPQAKHTAFRGPGKKGFTPDELMQRYFDKHGGGWND